MLIDDCGPKINDLDIKDLEVKLGAKLPVDYREFLLLYNGGSPTPDTVDVPDAPYMPTDVQEFFGIGMPIKTSNIFWNLDLVKEGYPDFNFLPIATDSGGCFFGLKIEKGVTSDIIYCALSEEGAEFYFVAPTFAEFLNKLRLL